jgi:uncharacterized protein YsxB (DUF464 family)
MELCCCAAVAILAVAFVLWLYATYESTPTPDVSEIESRLDEDERRK